MNTILKYRWYLIFISLAVYVQNLVDRTDYTTPHEIHRHLDVDKIIPSVLQSDGNYLFADKKQKILYNKKDIRCLVNNIFHEAGTDDMVGKLAVGQVTINRVQLGYWGESICDVVHAPSQFSWTDKNKEKIDSDSYNYKNSETAAELLLKHHVRIKPLNRALFYHADYVKPNWVDHQKYVGQFGKHVYYDGAKGSWLKL